MQELRSEIIGDRRVGLVAQTGDYYAVTIKVRGPMGWEDISLRADQDLVFVVAAGATASVWLSSGHARLS